MKSLLILFVSILIGSTANSQEPSIGDTIDVTIGSKTKRGEFIGYASNGRLVKIRTVINGKTYELSYPNRNVKVIERKGGTNKGATNNSATQKAENTKFRTWKDKTGRFELSAKLVAVSKTSVTLEKQDGKQVDVPLEKLSDADQKYLASRNKPTSLKPKGVLESDVTEVKILSINGPEIWNVSIEPLTAAVDGPAEISTPPVHRSVDGVLLTQDRKRFFFPGTAPNAPNFYLVNLNDGSLAWQGKSSARITRRTIPTDVASNSTTVVYAGRELYVATLRPSGAITGLVQWTPYKPVELDAAYAANWVKFIGDQHLLTSSAHLGTVVLWDWYGRIRSWRLLRFVIHHQKLLSVCHRRLN